MPDPNRTRFTDDRLQDIVDDVRGRLRVLESTPLQVAVMQARIDELRDSVRQISRKLDQMAEEQEDGRKWISRAVVGAFITLAVMALAALIIASQGAP